MRHLGRPILFASVLLSLSSCAALEEMIQELQADKNGSQPASSSTSTAAAPMSAQAAAVATAAPKAPTAALAKPSASVLLGALDAGPQVLNLSMHETGTLHGQAVVSGQKVPVAVSPDGQHFAAIQYQGSRVAVALDGEPGPVVDSVDAFKTMIFSPDSKRLAYVARIGQNLHMVIDGDLGPAFNARGPHSIAWSPDSSALLYQGGLAEENLQTTGWYLGREKLSDDVYRSCEFSPSGRFLVRRGTFQREAGYQDELQVGETVYLNVVEFAFTDDERLALVRNTDDGKVMEIFSAEGELLHTSGPRGDVVLPVFAERGARFAYAATAPLDPELMGQGQYEWLAIHGAKQYELGRNNVFELILSPDGARLAYMLHRRPDQVLVVDGKESFGYQGIPMFAFYDDGEHYAALATKDRQLFYLRDGEEIEGRVGNRSSTTAPPENWEGFISWSTTENSENQSLVTHLGFQAPQQGILRSLPMWYSPDGKTCITAQQIENPRPQAADLRLLRNGKLWKTHASAKLRPAATDVAWSPNGERVAYVLAETHQLDRGDGRVYPTPVVGLYRDGDSLTNWASQVVNVNELHVTNGGDVILLGTVRGLAGLCVYVNGRLVIEDLPLLYETRATHYDKVPKTSPLRILDGQIEVLVRREGEVRLERYPLSAKG